MNKILSQGEVDALLNSVAAPDIFGQSKSDSEATDSPPRGPAVSGTRRTTSYNFRRPDRVPKSMLRSLQLLHDKFCSNLSSSLSAYLRAITEVSLISVEQTSYNEFLLSLSDPTCFNAISIKPLTGMAALEIGLDLVFPLIDRLLGGAGHIPKISRNITEIEKTLIQGVIKVVTANLIEAWRPVSSIEFSLHASETLPQLLQIASASEIVILIVFELKIGEVRGNMHLCIPFAALESISANFEQNISIHRKRDQAGDFRNVVNVLYRTPVPVSAELTGTALSIKDLLSLKEGDVVKLDSKLSDRIGVHVAGIPQFEGQPLLVNSRKAAKIWSPAGT